MTPRPAATGPLFATCPLAGAACAGDITGAPGAHGSDADAAVSGPFADGAPIEMPPPDAANGFDLETRGYSLGYNSGVAPDGDEWEIRGLDIRSAANGCTEVNVPGFAIQVTVTAPDAAPTAEQILGVRRRAGRAHCLRPGRALIAARSFVIRSRGTPGRTASTSRCSVRSGGRA